MITTTFKLWRSAGAAAVLGLTACGGEGGEKGEHPSGGGEAGEGGASAPASAAGGAPGGGEQGEAGAASAYAGLSGDQLTALRLQHLKGFVLAAEALAETGQAEGASALVQQGLLEAHAPAPDQFGALDLAEVQAAGASADPDRAATLSHLRAAKSAIEAAAHGLDIDHAVLAARMVDIATGLYQGVVQPDFVDPIEYRHSYGAALAARDALTAGADMLRRRDGRAYRDAQSELDRFVALWPAPEAPPQPTSYRDVLAQSSRVRLALSPFL